MNAHTITATNPITAVRKVHLMDLLCKYRMEVTIDQDAEWEWEPNNQLSIHDVVYDLSVKAEWGGKRSDNFSFRPQAGRAGGDAYFRALEQAIHSWVKKNGKHEAAFSAEPL
jgi:hypothetical protein